MNEYEEALTRARAALNQLIEQQARLQLTLPEGSYHYISASPGYDASSVIQWPGFQPTGLVSHALGQDSAMEESLEEDGPRWLSQFR